MNHPCFLSGLFNLKQVMAGELGPDWQSKFKEFSMSPFAAASIGQVHRAVLHDGTHVVVKVQYPGVAESIDSDLAHLRSIALFSGMLPKGLFMDNSIEVAKRELTWETDYLREAHWIHRFYQAFALDPIFSVPKVFPELCTRKVLTMEFVEGVTLGNVADMPPDVRNWVATQLMKLTLKELFEFHFMQTDPNWSNFLYDPKEQKIRLLDFGSAREYSSSFLWKYSHVLEAAAQQDREGVLHWSQELQFLTGHETEVRS
jgi:aarF domain-containing kinase